MKIICHGGAGHTPKVQDGVDKAAEEGMKILKERLKESSKVFMVIMS